MSGAISIVQNSRERRKFSIRGKCLRTPPPDRRSSVRLGLAKPDDFVARLELPAFFKKLDPLEAFQDVSFRGNGADAFEAAML